MQLQQRPLKFLTEGVLNWEGPSELSQNEARGGKAFVLWHSVRAASGEKGLKSLQPVAVLGGNSQRTHQQATVLEAEGKSA